MYIFPMGFERNQLEFLFCMCLCACMSTYTDKVLGKNHTVPHGVCISIYTDRVVGKNHTVPHGVCFAFSTGMSDKTKSVIVM